MRRFFLVLGFLVAGCGVDPTVFPRHDGGMLPEAAVDAHGGLCAQDGACESSVFLCQAFAGALADRGCAGAAPCPWPMTQGTVCDTAQAEQVIGAIILLPRCTDELSMLPANICTSPHGG